MASGIQPLPSTVTKSEAAYASLREAIARGVLRPGQRLVLDELAGRLGISVGPVREATRRLEAEGLVSSTPHVGPTVREAAPAELVADYRILSALSGLAARLATPRLSGRDHEAIARHIEAIEENVAAGRSRGADEHNLRLHDRINRACGIKRLRTQIMDLWTFSIRRHHLLFGLVPGRAETANQEHRDILEALVARDALRAASLMREHLWHSADGFARHFGVTEPAMTEADEGGRERR